MARTITIADYDPIWTCGHLQITFSDNSNTEKLCNPKKEQYYNYKEVQQNSDFSYNDDFNA